MLDLRAHTMAIGENGVGKSSFMRLIFLFYGATPERILRGTQKHNLISYTLPGPSSAVAFEYEREEDDLRLAVMFAKPGVERPEFMIIDGGYKEIYFVDVNGHFVDREIFKDRLEALGIEVSERLRFRQQQSLRRLIAHIVERRKLRCPQTTQIRSFEPRELHRPHRPQTDSERSIAHLMSMAAIAAWPSVVASAFVAK